jgi:hypothetical protein
LEVSLIAVDRGQRLAETQCPRCHEPLAAAGEYQPTWKDQRRQWSAAVTLGWKMTKCFHPFSGHCQFLFDEIFAATWIDPILTTDGRSVLDLLNFDENIATLNFALETMANFRRITIQHIHGYVSQTSLTPALPHLSVLSDWGKRLFLVNRR